MPPSLCALKDAVILPRDKSRRHGNTGEFMKSLHPYIDFGGKCREAMTFYKAVFHGELTCPKRQS